MTLSIFSYVCRIIMYGLLSIVTCSFFHGMLGRKKSFAVTSAILFCFFFTVSLIMRTGMVSLVERLQMTNLQMIFFNITTSIVVDGLTILLICVLFHGSRAKKLAIIFTYMVLNWMTTYVPQTVVLFFLEKSGFLQGSSLQADLMFSVAVVSNCTALYLVSRHCKNLTYILPDRISMILLMQSAFILIMAYVVTAVVDFLDVFRVLNQYGILKGPPEMYQMTGIAVTAGFCVLGLFSNLVLVFGINNIMETVLAQEQLKLQMRHYEELNQTNNRFLAVRHDMKNHMITLSSILERNDVAGAREYVQHLTEESSLSVSGFHTGNSSADALLGAKRSVCAQNGIELEVNLQIPRLKNVTDFDLSVLLGNALDNAIQACRVLPKNERKAIVLDSAVVQEYFVCRIKNPCAPEGVTHADGQPHGIGLKNMKRSVEKYQGMLKTERTDGVFVVSFFLPTDRL